MRHYHNIIYIAWFRVLIVLWLINLSKLHGGRRLRLRPLGGRVGVVEGARMRLWSNLLGKQKLHSKSFEEQTMHVLVPLAVLVGRSDEKPCLKVVSDPRVLLWLDSVRKKTGQCQECRPPASCIQLHCVLVAICSSWRWANHLLQSYNFKILKIFHRWFCIFHCKRHPKTKATAKHQGALPQKLHQAPPWSNQAATSAS